MLLSVNNIVVADLPLAVFTADSAAFFVLSMVVATVSSGIKKENAKCKFKKWYSNYNELEKCI